MIMIIKKKAQSSIMVIKPTQELKALISHWAPEMFESNEGQPVAFAVRSACSVCEGGRPIPRIEVK